MDKGQQRLAVIAQGWYLINLLALPVIGFAALLYLFLRHAGRRNHDVGAQHVYQALVCSLWGAALLTGGLGVFWWVGAYGANGWAAVLLYLIVVHTGFVMIGILGMARAMAVKPFYPVPFVRKPK